MDPVEGLMLLPSTLATAYAGVDRDPFEPMLLEEYFDNNPNSERDRISDFYPPGPRRDLYRQAEAASIEPYGFLFRDRAVAVELQHALAKAGQGYDVVWAGIADIGAPPQEWPSGLVRIGYDVAYMGGDFYSAVNNGLFINPDPELVRTNLDRVNQYGLFDDPSAAERYFAEFIASSVTERASRFVRYQLGLLSASGSRTA